jgi:hypothetical protein
MSEPVRPEDLRVSDDDRHRVAEVLRQAAGEGRIDLDELDERLEATYAARTYGDLVPLTVDLPAASAPAAAKAQGAPAVVDGPAHSRHLAMMGGVERRGAWTVPAAMTVTCFMGGASLDLRRARFAAQECVLTVNAVMGGAAIVVPPGIDVVVDGVGIMGGFGWSGADRDDEVGPGAPRLRVRGLAFWGGVSIERKAPDDPPKLDRGTVAP